jgi:RHS repeat-associated protein
METDDGGNPTAAYTNDPGPFGGLISGRQGSQSQYYHFDALGSTRQLTNSTGLVTDTCLDDAFGNTIQSTGSSVVPYHFIGRLGYYYDGETARYYVRARYLGTVLALWFSQDPLGLLLAPSNLYTYAANNPLVVIDPSGLADVVTGPCQINIWAGDTLVGKNNGNLGNFYNNNTGQNAYQGIPDQLCPSQYLGVVGCGAFAPGGANSAPPPLFKTPVPGIPGNQQIPGFPVMPPFLPAASMMTALTDALNAADALSAQLCMNRKKFCDDGTPPRYQCGANNQRCDSVTITPVWDSFVQTLLTTGIGPNGTQVPGLPSPASMQLLARLRSYPKRTNCT